MHVYQGPDDHPLLALQDASMSFLVQDAAAADRCSSSCCAAAPVVFLHGAQAAARPASCSEAQHSVGKQSGWRQCEGDAGSDLWCRELSPQEEGSIALWLAGECQDWLASLPSSAEADAAQLAAMSESDTSREHCRLNEPVGSGLGQIKGAARCEGAEQHADAGGVDGRHRRQDDLHEQQVTGTQGGKTHQRGLQQRTADKQWLSHANRTLALQWRLCRKQLMARAELDLQLQACFLQQASMPQTCSL